MGKKLTIEDFILKSKNTHGEKYDYSKVEYINCMKKVIIICQIHGEFEQTPLNHIQGNICKKCSIDNVSSNQRKVLEFIRNSDIKYNNKYDYSKVYYINRKTKVIIICPIHGEFMTTPVNHLNSSGCTICSKNNRREINKKIFIQKSLLIHNNKYDYSIVDYKSDKIKVNIFCKEHGGFLQQPNTHLNGVGCPKCSSSKGELKILDFFNKNQIKYYIEHKFNDCLNIRNLQFDFYLPEFNTCIEYDGKQHFEPIDFFGGNDGFNKTKINDSIKNKYCLDNKIGIIRIPYTEYDKIEKILRDKLWVL